MDQWKTIVKTALIGTDRGQLPADAKQSFKALGIATLENQEAQILECAAYLSMMQKAGFQAQKFSDKLPEACPSENAQICNPKSIRHLSLILSGSFVKALPEFIYYMQKNGKNLPPEKWPDLFNIALKNKKFWAQIEGQLDERGQWLLQQNSAWEKLNTIIDPNTDWELANSKTRMKLLQFFRKENPAKAIQLIQSTWSEDSLNHRQKFVKNLEENLSIADEFFLEELLDDGRKEIRENAAILLMQLPASMLIKRMEKRLAVIMRIEGKGKKMKMEVDLPTKLTEEMARDGIVAQKIRKRGIKANYLFQIIKAVPPSFWNENFALETVDCLNLFLNSDFDETIYAALLLSPHLLSNSDWLETLVFYIVENQHTEFIQDLRPHWLPLLQEKIPEKMVHEVIEYLITSGSNITDVNEILYTVLGTVKRQLPKKIALQIIDQLRTELYNGTAGHESEWLLKNMFLHLGFKMPENIFDTAQRRLMEVSNKWGRLGPGIDSMLNTLGFRKDMIKELEN